jgi:hypothetical protein
LLHFSLSSSKPFPETHYFCYDAHSKDNFYKQQETNF